MDWLLVQCTERDGNAVVRLSGELDVATAPLLCAELDVLVADGASRLILDLSELAFLDAAGSAALMHARRISSEYAGWVRLVGVRPQAQRVLRLLRLTEALPAFTSLESAGVDIV